MITDKKIVVIGSGVSGVGAVKLLEAAGAVPTLYDSNEKLTEAEVRKRLPEGSKCKVVQGEFPENLKKETELVVLSPGVPVDLPLVEELRTNGAAIWGEVELAYHFGKGKIAAITGTNGKTTTTFILKGIFDNLGIKSGLIGTVKNVTGDKEYPSSLTTPDSKELQRLFREMVDSGCKYCVMEVSSQALAQGRVDGCHFDIALFTNLTQDHLDYHKTFENYRNAKRKLFEISDTAVINIDDESAHYMVDGLPIKVVTFSVKNNEAQFVAKNVVCTSSSVQYELLWNDKIGRANVGIPGHFTVYNTMGAAICAILTGLDFSDVLSSLKKSKGVPGRVEVVPTDTDYTVLIDYAHSPDGLENVISSVRETTNGRIIAVFGCGGDRDKTKRPKMGKIVGDLADVAVVTSDNPRSEDPQLIVDDVLEGMHNCKAKIKVLVDRTEAIRYALGEAKKGDVVLLAGKGHETYQILNTGKIHYDEREVVAGILAEGKDK